MGSQAVAFFSDAERLGGIPAKVRLASLARITSAEASAATDDQALIQRLERALSRLRREIDGTSVSGVYTPVSAPSGPVEKIEDRLRRHMGTVVDLMSQRAMIMSDVNETFRRVNEATSHALNVARVSVWMLNDDKTKITCADLFDSPKRSHSAGMELSAGDYPAYFTAIQSERSIVAFDARSDPRTAIFTKGYLEPNNIGAMLDVPIMARGKMVGVVCNEHVGSSRLWDGDDERFAYLAANFVSLALERTRPPMPSSLPPQV